MIIRAAVVMTAMLAWLTLAACPAAMAQMMGGQGGQEVSGRAVLDKASYKPGEVAKIVVKLDIVAGFHLNADAAQQPIGMPLQAVLEADPAFSLVKITYPKAHLVKLAFSDKEAPVFENKAELNLEVAIAANAAKGQGKGSVIITYQGCNSQMCFMPVDLAVPFVIEID